MRDVGVFTNFLKRKSPTAPSAVPSEPKPPYLTQTVVFGRGDSSVCFVDEARGIRKTLINATGFIQHFPGIVQEQFWVSQVSKRALLPQIRYRTSFEKRSGKWLMLWEIQPDGEYWRDEDGFGAENDEEVTLCTYVNLDGNFTGPFRIYKIGRHCCSLDRYEHAHEQHYETSLRKLKDGMLDQDAEFLFPWIHGMELRAGFRSVSDYYSLWNREDAAAYWKHPVLSGHLIEVSHVLLELDAPVMQIVEYPYHKGVHSCMTLFYAVTRNVVFKQVLDRLFNGEFEQSTMKRIENEIGG